MSEKNDIGKGRCLSCRHWQGDKDGVRKDIDSSGQIAMDMENGWPRTGGCEVDHKCLEVVISGDATYTLYVPANFGCVLYEEDCE